MLFRAKEACTAPIIERFERTPLHAYVHKGQTFEWIAGPPYPLNVAEPEDDEAKAAVGVAVEAVSNVPEPVLAPIDSSMAERMAKVRAARKGGRPKGSKNKPKVAAPVEPASEG